MLTRIRTILSREDGASAVEYGLLVALIAAVIVVGVGAVGTALNAKFNSISTTVAK